MLPKSKTSSSPSSILLTNPIQNYYEIGEQTATAGPENIWRIYDAYSKDTHKEVSIFLFDKRSVDTLYKWRRKETIAEILRNGAQSMEQFTHPKILHVYRIGECDSTLAFASEPVLGSLANVLAYKEASTNTMAQNASAPKHRKAFIKKYELLSIEIKYGLLQIIEALGFLHQTCNIIHRNICPRSIIITKRGTWKLAGFEFLERVTEYENTGEIIPVAPWRSNLSKLIQPSLDYLPPEVQRSKYAGYFSDMYSLGMTICAIFNFGRPLIQASHNPAMYIKQIANLGEQLTAILPDIPRPLQEAVQRLLDTNTPEGRPNAHVVSQITYFRDDGVYALQFLDTIKMANLKDKEQFYTKKLIDVLLYIPKKLWFQHIWPHLQDELESKEGISAILQPVFYIIQKCNPEEFEYHIFPRFRSLFVNPKSIMCTVTLLENLRIILEKVPEEYIETDVLPMLYNAFDNSTMQVQNAAFIAVANVSGYIKDEAIKGIVLPKLLLAFSKEHSAEQRVLMNVIPLIMQRLEKQNIVDDILPLLCNRELVSLQDPDILERVIDIYRKMLKDKEIGIPINWMANRAMPSLLPQTVNANLNAEQFSMLFELIQTMLIHIERSQRNRFSRDNLSLSSPERHWALRHQSSASNIPNVRVDQRKTSSAEDMARKNSISSILMTASAENMTRQNSMSAAIGSWFNRSVDASSTVSDNNFLKVVNAFTARRLSDNSVMSSRNRLAPSAASSPGGTTGGILPVRRHSSIGAQERRGLNTNLSPPTVSNSTHYHKTFKGLPITSRSVPFLPDGNSFRGSRRISVSSTSSQPGSGLLQQVGSSVIQFFNRQSNA